MSPIVLKLDDVFYACPPLTPPRFAIYDKLNSRKLGDRLEHRFD